MKFFLLKSKKIQNEIIFIFLLAISIILIFFPPFNVPSRDFVLLFQFLGLAIGIERGWNLIKILDCEPFSYIKAFFKIFFFFAIPIILIPFFSYFILKCNVEEGICFYIISVPTCILFGFIYGSYFKILLKKIKFFFIINSIIFILLLFSNKLLNFLLFLFGNFLDRRMNFYPTKIFIISRLSIFLFSLILFLVLFSFHKNIAKIKIYSLIFLASFFGFFFFWEGIFMGTNLYKILLDKKIEIPYWRIYTSSNSLIKNDDLRYIQWCGYWIRKQLGIEDNKPTEIYIFPDHKTFKNITDMNVGAFGWKNKIAINIDYIRTDFLPHELVHSLHYRLKPSKFVTFRRAITEGLATAISKNMHIFKKEHIDIAILEKKGKLPSIVDIYNDYFFFFHSENLSYDASGSFIGFLIMKYGIKDFIKFQRDLNFFKTYNKSLKELNGEWKEFLKNIDIKSLDKEKDTLYYYEEPYLKCNCPQVGSRKMDEKEIHWYFNRKIEPYENLKIYIKLVIEYPEEFNWKENLLYSLISLKRFDLAKEKAIYYLNKYNKNIYAIYELNKILFWISILEGKKEDAIKFMEKMAEISGEESIDKIRLEILKNSAISNYYTKSLHLPFREKIEMLKNLKDMAPDFAPAHFYFIKSERNDLQEKFLSFKYFFENMKGFIKLKENMGEELAEEFIEKQEYGLCRDILKLLEKNKETDTKIFILKNRLEYEEKNFKKKEYINLEPFYPLTSRETYKDLW